MVGGQPECAEPPHLSGRLRRYLPCSMSRGDRSLKADELLRLAAEHCARLAIGLSAVPLIGLGLMLGGSRKSKAGKTASGTTTEDVTALAQEAVAKGGGLPPRAEVDAALSSLSDRMLRRSRKRPKKARHKA